MEKETALITGASSGIGLELAREFAGHGHPLILVARVASELRSIAAEFERSFDVPVRTIAKDLQQEPEAAREIYEELKRDRTQVDILVNNAGLGQRGKFWETPLEKDLAIVGVNIEAMLCLTKLFLPAMIRRDSGRLLFTTSVAGFEPGPLLAVYHASKAFVLSLSESLGVELEDTHITVTALCPGPTDTDFFPKANMVQTKIFQKGNVMPPQEVAAKDYEAMMRGDRTFVPGLMNKALVGARRVLSKPAQARLNKKFYEEAAPKDRNRRHPGDIAAKARPKGRRRAVTLRG